MALVVYEVKQYIVTCSHQGKESKHHQLNAGVRSMNGTIMFPKRADLLNAQSVLKHAYMSSEEIK
jgi:hypothetical protein